MTTEQTITQQITDNSVILYMKGSPKLPQCGFSMRVVQILEALGVEFAFVDVLANPDIRATLKTYSNWPTFPQLYIAGEFVGGCDIVTEMFENGELKTMLEQNSLV